MTVLRRLCTLVLGIALPILSINLALADDRVVSDEMRQAQSILLQGLLYDQPQPEPLAAEERVTLNQHQILLEELTTVWDQAVAALKAGRFTDLGEHVIALNEVKYKLGFDALEDYSIYLLTHAKERIKAGDRAAAKFFTQRAIFLSPRSPRVLLSATELVRTSGGSVSSHIFNIALAIKTNPGVLLRWVTLSVYPLLWAVTFALYCVFVVVFAFYSRMVLREIAAPFAPRWRAWVCIPVGLSLLITPCIAGPMWCLLAWSFLIFWLLPEKSWLGFLSGALVCLWGALIPLRETLTDWLDDEGVQAMLNVGSGYFSATDQVKIERLSSRRPNDGVVYFFKGQLYRKLGLYDRAEDSFTQAELHLGEQPWIKGQRGMIAFLRNDIRSADTLYTDARKQGLNSPALLYNLSRVKFELTDVTASKRLLQRARRMDPQLIAKLSDRERILGMGNRHAIGEINLPLKRVIQSAMIPVESGVHKQRKLADALMIGATPVMMMIAGGLIVLGFILNKGRQRRKRFITFYKGYRPSRLLSALLRLVPGGAWVISGNTVVGLLILVIALLCLMPILAWPVGVMELVELGQSAYGVYVGIYVGVLSLFVLIGFSLEEEDA